MIIIISIINHQLQCQPVCVTFTVHLQMLSTELSLWQIPLYTNVFKVQLLAKLLTCPGIQWSTSSFFGSFILLNACCSENVQQDAHLSVMSCSFVLYMA